MSKILTRDAYDSAREAGADTPSDALLVAVADIDRESTEYRAAATATDPYVRQFRASTGDVDRHNSTIAVKGWDLKAVKSGVVPFLWAHNESASYPPIGTVSKAWTEADGLHVQVRFTPPDMDHPLGRGFGNTVLRMYDEGFLKGVSVGLAPKEVSVNQERLKSTGMGQRIPLDYTKQELVELSAVPVPSNVGALHEAINRNAEYVAPIVDWLKAIRDAETEHPLLTRSIAADILAPTMTTEVIRYALQTDLLALRQQYDALSSAYADLKAQIEKRAEAPVMVRASEAKITEAEYRAIVARAIASVLGAKGK